MSDKTLTLALLFFPIRKEHLGFSGSVAHPQNNNDLQRISCILLILGDSIIITGPIMAHL